MFSKSLFVASVLAASVNAQSTVSQAMPPVATQSFNPGLVQQTDAASWCIAQTNTCPQICASTLYGSASINTCDPTSFTYSCVCRNGTTPDVTAYAQTLPFFICQATFQQCTLANKGDAQAQANCATNEQCGSKNASALEAVASAPSSSATSASKTSAIASATSAAASSASAAATSNAAVAHMGELTTGAFAAVLFAAFKLFV